MIYLITYDLNAEGQNYDALYEQIESAADSCRILESVWLISTNQTTVHWRDKLKSVVDDNDDIFVVDITNSSWAYSIHIAKVRNWINKYLKND